MDISIKNFDYDLPEERIAKYPLPERDQSKLLYYKEGKISDHVFSQLPELLPANTMMIFNNTKVIRARLPFKKSTGAQIEIFCLEPIEPFELTSAFAQNKEVVWNCMVGNLKKWKEGPLETIIQNGQAPIHLSAEKVNKTQEGFAIRFKWNNPNFTFSELMDYMGKTPIPPYLNRDSEEIDTVRYQTVYSKEKGSVAAPTAGLHFTDNVINRMKNNGVSIQTLTLHVGAGTFRPVKSENVADHEMHTEHFRISLETLKNIQRHKGIRIAVGTTSLRTLESLYWAGVLCHLNQPFHHIGQWTPYHLKSNLRFEEALENLIESTERSGKTHFEGSTAIIIAPGYQIKSIDAIVTNFHQPKSTLLLLIAAVVGDEWKRIYSHALKNNYRFLSYGDSSLLWKSSLL